jgi:hypothetical protein
LPKELRVHGVSGTPPSELLYTAPVTYDQSRELARVFEPNRDVWDVRAFHWGSLTSRSSLTAFWILLAPFAMANVAGWMSESPNVWSRIWVRVAGLSLTGIFFAQIANMALEIPLSAGTSPGAVKWMFGVVCLGLVLGLGLLSTQSTFRPLPLRERLRHLFTPTVGAMNPLLKEPEWDDPAHDIGVVGYRMWSVHSIVHRLRRIHLAFGMATLAIVAARVVGAPGLEAGSIALAGLALICLAFTTGPFATNPATLWLTALLPTSALAVLVWGLVTIVRGEIGPGNVADDLTFQIALILGIAAGLGLIGELAKSRFRAGWVPLGLLAVATLLGGTLGLTGSMLVETYLTSSDATAETFDSGAAFVTVGLLGMVLVMAVTFLVSTFIPRKPSDRTRTRRGILRARAILASAGVYGVIMGAVAVLGSCLGGEGCTQANIVMPGWVVEDPDNLSVLLGLPFDPTSILGWAKILMVAIPAALIVRSIVGGLLNGQDSRRQVGILWDLGSFWPRWFHPLAPPAYGPYAVTRLQTVITEQKPDVVAAHSQGSLISAVALCLADEDATPSLFITYGSQIGDLYPSLFPAVGFDRLVATASTQLGGRWLNLWRPTDGVGGQPIDDLGSRNWEVRTGTGHSRYELTPEFCAARETAFSGNLARPSDMEMIDCWGG